MTTFKEAIDNDDEVEDQIEDSKRSKTKWGDLIEDEDE
jgi:hypothetical protein